MPLLDSLAPALVGSEVIDYFDTFKYLTQYIDHVMNIDKAIGLCMTNCYFASLRC